MCSGVSTGSQRGTRDREIGWDRTELHLELSTSSHTGIVVNALEAGNVGMPQLSLLH